MRDRSKFGKILGLVMLLLPCTGDLEAWVTLHLAKAAQGNIITANVGKGLLSTLVQLGPCINLFFTFPLMMNPVYEVFERRFWGGNYCLCMRWMLVLGVSLVALYAPNFADFLSLVGSSTCCALGFVLPALFHYLTFKEDMSRRRASADLGIIILGVFLGVMGTWYFLSWRFYL